jgi:prepilin-type processing-associated H-X9-DG protein
LVVIAIIALLISILLPSLSRARELSKRLVCASNIKGIGTSAKIYANDNNEKWMIPPFMRLQVDRGGIDYLCREGAISCWSPTASTLDPGCVGWKREDPSTSETPASPTGGSEAVSTTRAYWMMVRSGDITVKQFICPSAGEDQDDTENLDLYYDFTCYDNVSYGYQVPFGPRDTQPHEGMDNRQIVAADKGPYYLTGSEPDWDSAGNPPPIDLDDSPKAWRAFNSANHGGSSNGEGQNCLYADGHASFQRRPSVGIDNDNIYTQMTDEWGNTPLGSNRFHGWAPLESAEDYPYPGQNAFCSGTGCFASTDTLIYP